MRTVVTVAAIALLAGCPEKRKGQPMSEPPPVSARPDGAAAPGTAGPADAPISRSSARYDPATDPANTGGFKFVRRKPGDPADARKKPFSIEALYRLKSSGSPRWSPDGSAILFTVSRYDLAEGKTNTDIYFVRGSGKGLRRMTHHKASDWNPRWAPDGRAFLFLSGREKGVQIWRMPIDGGEAERLTSVSTGVSDPIWSPDGKRIAFTSRVFPEHGADDQANKKLLDRIEKSPLKAHLADELLYRHWSYYKDGRRAHVLLLDVATQKVTDLTPGDFDSPAFSLGGGGGYAFSPDSQELCFVSNRDPGSGQAWTTNKDLFVVPIRGGPARNLTGKNKAYDGHPVYSPDGAHIAFLRQEKPGYEADRFTVALYERKTGKIRVLTGGFDNWVVDLRWTEKGKALIVKVTEKGRYPLFRLDAASGRMKRLALPSARGWDIGPAGRIAFTFTRIGEPVELFVAGADGKGARRLTHFNKAVQAEFDIRPAEEIWVKGADGRMVHTFIVKPHGFRPGVRYPLIINVHGGPQGMWSDRLRGDWQIYPGAGYVVAFPNPHGSIGYGQAYTAAISRDWGGKVYEDVMAVTEHLSKLPYVDPNRMGAMGWSYGGYMMNWLLGHTTRFKAIASMMGVYDLVSFYGATEELWFPEWDLGKPWSDPAALRKWSPSTYAGKFKTPTLIIAGEKDFRVPYTQSLQLFTALRRQGVPSRLIVFPNDGHWPSFIRSMPLYYAAHLDWFHRYLGGGKSPYDIRALVQGRGFGKKN